MLQNAHFLAKIGADTAENEQHFAEILPTDALWRRRHDRGKAEPRTPPVGPAGLSGVPDVLELSGRVFARDLDERLRLPASSQLVFSTRSTLWNNSKKPSSLSDVALSLISQGNGEPCFQQSELRQIRNELFKV